MLSPTSLPPTSQVYFERYHNKYNCDVIWGIIIAWVEVITVTRRDQSISFMKLENFEDHELHCVQIWFIFIREGSETHFLKIVKKGRCP